MKNLLFRTLLILLIIGVSINTSVSQNKNKLRFLDNLEFNIEFGLSNFDLVEDISGTYLDDNFRKNFMRRVKLEKRSFYAGILVRKLISDEKVFSVESGFTYRKRGASNSNNNLDLHNIQIPVVLIADLFQEKNHSLLLKLGGFGSFSLIRTVPDYYMIEDIRRVDFGIIAGIGYRFKIKKMKFEIWSHIGSGSYFWKKDRYSPGGNRYDVKSKNRFFELGVLFPILSINNE